MSGRRTRTIEQTVIIPASPKQVYRALMDPKEHAEFTGDAAEGSGEVGGVFRAYGGYISARNIELEEGKRIVQEWSTSEWPEGSPPSRLEIRLTSAKGGTELHMTHSMVPAEQADGYAEGWQEHYWSKLQEHFLIKKGRKKP
ncbi:MAG: SRPBCC domain-containing protein [Methanomassiliicoccales archaeon]|nr:SRPBCC domain-containing protein [Methanomassiliicoccales archaeon]